MRTLRWHSNPGDWILYLLVLIIVTFSVVQSIAKGQEIPFSMSNAEATPLVVREAPKDSTEMDFSIHQEVRIVQDDDLIGFSVHNAKPMEVGSAKPDCSDARQANRVLVIVDQSKRKEQRQVQICEKGKPCRWVMQTVEVEHASSQQVLKDLEKLSKSNSDWKVGDDECVHFKIVDWSDSRNVDMIKELDIQQKDLPLLVKEAQLDQRKKAAGMKMEELAKWYIQKYMQPTPEGVQQQGPQVCVPNIGGFAGGPRWDYNRSGSLRQHLTDPRGLHHLPKAVVDQWSDAQVQAWHNWHHEVMEGHKVQAAPANVTKPVPLKPQASKSVIPVRQVSFGYSRGSLQNEMANFALSVAQQTARAPPPRASFGSDPKKASKAEKKWKEQERSRIRKEVRRQVWNKYATFDPFTILTIIQVIIQILNFIFSQYGLN